MMNIALCEDNQYQRRQIVESILAWSNKRQAQSRLAQNGSRAGVSVPSTPIPKIREYANANSFFFNYEEDGPFDLLLLDIDLSGNDNTNPGSKEAKELATKTKAALLNTRKTNGASATTGSAAGGIATNEDGLNIAAKIREQDSEVVIVFITSNTWHVFEGYKVQAFDFLAKPLKQRELERVLDHTNSKQKKVAEQTFLLDTGTGVKRISLSDIYYFEAQRQFVKMHGVHGVQTFRARISNITAELGSKDFILPHRSFLVNMVYIQSVGSNTITMFDGRLIPISRNRAKETMSSWIEYFGSGASDDIGSESL
jgi:DNA-binding LytR/AlgR family response regulator